MPATALLAKTLSHVGLVRDENQDTTRLLVPADTRVRETHGSLLAIADGMGGYAKGGVASVTAIDTFFEAFYRDTLDSRPAALKGALEQANLAVHQASFRLNAGQMGTTLTVANVAGDRLYLAHVGDTRAYLVRDGQARCLTNDHSLVAELVRMKVISPDKVRTHAQRSVLNRSLGLNLFVQPDISHITLLAGDVIILCSDGLWAYVQDAEFAVMSTQMRSVDELGERLVSLALERQTDDNASVVVARVEQVGTPAAADLKPLSAWNRVAAALHSLF